VALVSRDRASKRGDVYLYFVLVAIGVEDTACFFGGRLTLVRLAGARGEG